MDSVFDFYPTLSRKLGFFSNASHLTFRNILILLFCETLRSGYYLCRACAPSAGFVIN